MNNIPHLESNYLPSQLNTSKSSGVVSQLSNVSESKPSYDCVTIDDMRGNPLYQKMDDIDKVGVAQKSILEAASKVKSKTKFIRALNDLAQKRNIPSKNVKK